MVYLEGAVAPVGFGKPRVLWPPRSQGLSLLIKRTWVCLRSRKFLLRPARQISVLRDWGQLFALV